MCRILVSKWEQVRQFLLTFLFFPPSFAERLKKSGKVWIRKIGQMKVREWIKDSHATAPIYLATPHFFTKGEKVFQRNKRPPEWGSFISCNLAPPKKTRILKVGVLM